MQFRNQCDGLNLEHMEGPYMRVTCFEEVKVDLGLAQRPLRRLSFMLLAKGCCN